uniref:Uncharacterized protein n=1 Tax=Triticum urartu TaxID=4572 RepID=A0A8R7TT00_TRIUA
PRRRHGRPPALLVAGRGVGQQERWLPASGRPAQPQRRHLLLQEAPERQGAQVQESLGVGDARQVPLRGRQRRASGKLRYRNRNSRNGAAPLSVWTPADYPDSTEWTLEYGTRPATRPLVCQGRSPCLGSSMCSASTCVLARSWAARSTSSFRTKTSLLATRFVHAWQLPRALRSGCIYIHRPKVSLPKSRCKC